MFKNIEKSTVLGVKPVVPTTMWMPRSTHQVMFSMTASGWVKSTTTWAWPIWPR